MKFKNTILVVGCGGHARFILSLAANSPYKALGLIDIKDDFNDSDVIMNVPVIGCLSFIHDLYNLGHRNIALAIGDNNLRKKTFYDLLEAGFNFPNLIHSSSIIDPSATLGIGNVIGPNTVIGSEVIIGDNNIINSGAVIEHQSKLGNNNHASVSSTVCGNVKIGNCVFLGANSVVIDKISVSNETILGAGASLISSVTEPGQTLVGCPAKGVNK